MPRILIVDDDANVGSALRRVFRRAGFEVMVADCGEKALARLCTFDPDVVVSDYRMPGMHGGQVLSEVRRLKPSALRYMLSGYVESEPSVEEALRDAVARFMQKPWDDDALVQDVKEWLAERAGTGSGL